MYWYKREKNMCQPPSATLKWTIFRAFFSTHFSCFQLKSRLQSYGDFPSKRAPVQKWSQKRVPKKSIIAGTIRNNRVLQKRMPIIVIISFQLWGGTWGVAHVFLSLMIQCFFFKWSHGSCLFFSFGIQLINYLFSFKFSLSQCLCLVLAGLTLI